MLGVARQRAEASAALWSRLNGTPGRPFVVAGTNVLGDSEEEVLKVAQHVKEVCAKLGLEVVFKASWDKANRTARGAYRGVGLDRGLQMLDMVKKELGLPIVTDVHEVWQVGRVAQVADIVQVPSFLCRQTDLITAVAESGRIVNLKRGQFASAGVMGHAVAKAWGAGAKHVMVCERGLMFGLDDLVFDPRQICELRESCRGLDGMVAPIIVDATHCCQKPPSASTMHASGGRRDMVPVVARAAAAVGIDGIFVECHPDPQNAPVDGALQLALADLEPLLQDVLEISRIVARRL